MQFVHEEDGAGLLCQGLEHGLEPLLEVAPVAAARQQGPQVQGVDAGRFQGVGHRALMDAPGQSLDDGGLAHAWLAHQQRVVLAAPAQHLGHAGNLGVPTHQGIQPPGGGPGHQVRGVGLQGVHGDHGLVLRLVGRGLPGRGLGRGRAMAQHLEQGEPLHPVALQEVARVAGLLLQEGRQQLARKDLLPAGAERVDERPLHHPHKAQGAVGLEGLALGHRVEGLGQHALQVGAEGFKLHAAAQQGPGGMGILQQGQQQVLKPHVLVAADLGEIEGPLEILVQIGADLGRVRHVRPPP